MKVVRARDVDAWNMSISIHFGKTPKINIRCGKCGNWFARRFAIEELPDPVTKCTHCKVLNEVPIKY